MTASISELLQMLAFWSPGPAEMVVLAVVALLLYGGKLPEMARTWGKSLAELRRSLSGIQNEFNEAMYAPPDQLEYSPEQDPYAEESVNEYSGYDEESQDDGSLEEGSEDEDSQTKAAVDDPPADETAADDPTVGDNTTEVVDTTAESPAEKPRETNSD